MNGKGSRVKAQAILEYILVLTAIVVAFIWATKDEDSIIQKAIRNMMSDAAGVIEDSSSKFAAEAAGGYAESNAK